jgi:hypothetical protein
VVDAAKAQAAELRPADDETFIAYADEPEWLAADDAKRLATFLATGPRRPSAAGAARAEEYKRSRERARRFAIEQHRLGRISILSVDPEWREEAVRARAAEVEGRGSVQIGEAPRIRVGE